MIELMERRSWTKVDGERPETYIQRIKLQTQHMVNFRLSRGSCYMIKFGEDDIRPMFEDQISISKLKQELRTPVNTHWDCPLCQPYDNWTGLADIENNRRFLCRIVSPKYEGGAIDEEGTYTKCVCILRAKYKKGLKFKP